MEATNAGRTGTLSLVPGRRSEVRDESGRERAEGNTRARICARTGTIPEQHAAEQGTGNLQSAQSARGDRVRHRGARGESVHVPGGQDVDGRHHGGRTASRVRNQERGGGNLLEIHPPQWLGHEITQRIAHTGHPRHETLPSVLLVQTQRYLLTPQDAIMVTLPLSAVASAATGAGIPRWCGSIAGGTQTAPQHARCRTGRQMLAAASIS